MAKRGADAQLTKDDAENDGSDNEGVREQPLAPIEGRQIRGIPKRRGMASGNSSPAPPTASQFPVPPVPAVPNFSFNMQSPTTALFGSTPKSATTTTFGFGSASSTAPSASKHTTFGFGSAAAPPPAKSSPFGGFSFTAPAPKPAVPEKTEDTAAVTPAPPKQAFAGFSFAKPAPVTKETHQLLGSSSAKSADKPSHTIKDGPQFTSFSFAKPADASGSTTSSTEPAPGTSNSTPVNGSGALGFSTGANTSSTVPDATSTITSSSSGVSPSQSDPPPEGEVSYYTAARGLNHSIITFLTKSISDDPFIDLSKVLPGLSEQYAKHLDEASSKGGWKPSGSTSTPAENGSATKSNGYGFVPPTPTTGGFKPPTAPSGGFTFAGSTFPPSAPSSSSKTATGGFTPTAAASTSSSPFSFRAKPAAPPSIKKPSAEVTKLVEEVITPKAPEVDTPKPAETPAPTFSFGSTSTPPTFSSETKKPTPLFSFAPSGPLQPATPDGKSFTPSAKLEDATPPAKLGKFGPGGSQPQLAFGGASGGTKSVTGFGFGSGSGFSIGASPAGPSTSAFSFGAKPATSATPVSTPAFSFGQIPGSSTATPAAPASSPFTFNTSAAPSFSTTPAPSTAEGEDGESSTAPGSPGKNLAEGTGAGEEGEDTVATQRCRLLALVDGAWKAVGLGQMKIKRSAEGGGKRKRRLLMRADGGGNVVYNMSLSDKFEVTVEDKKIKFLGFDLDGKAKPYMMQIKTKDEADKFADLVKSEVEGLKNE